MIYIQVSVVESVKCDIYIQVSVVESVGSVIYNYTG